MVLQSEYFLLGQPVESKRQKLARIGTEVGGNSKYSQILKVARVYVAGHLRVSFSTELELAQ